MSLNKTIFKLFIIFVVCLFFYILIQGIRNPKYYIDPEPIHNCFSIKCQ